MEYTRTDRALSGITSQPQTEGRRDNSAQTKAMLKTKRKYIEINPANENGFRWIENISTGWRLVGFADELARIDHKGWFTDNDGFGEVMRGIVYKLPTHKGSPVYFVGYDDPNNSDAAYGQIRTDLDDDADAARAADAIAEKYAEQEREYQDAWRLGQDYYDAGETIQHERQARRELFAELRTIRAQLTGTTPALCSAIKDAITRSKRHAIEAYERRRDILNNYSIRRELIDAFADGAELSIDDAKNLF